MRREPPPAVYDQETSNDAPGKCFTHLASFIQAFNICVISRHPPLGTDVMPDARRSMQKVGSAQLLGVARSASLTTQSAENGGSFQFFDLKGTVG
jgi:hypothetical protein